MSQEYEYWGHCIAGHGQSKDMLLERMLGHLDYEVVLGEMRLLLDWSFTEDQLHAYRAQSNECQFKEAIGER